MVEDLLTLELAKAAPKTTGINQLKVVENRPFFPSIKCNNFLLKEVFAASGFFGFGSG